jgi:hypothetical protein
MDVTCRDSLSSRSAGLNQHVKKTNRPVLTYEWHGGYFMWMTKGKLVLKKWLTTETLPLLLLGIDEEFQTTLPHHARWFFL